MKMKRSELAAIGVAFAQEYYRLCKENGVPESDMITCEKVCELTGKSRGWVYNQAKDLPHANGLYSRTAVLEYIRK